MTKTLIIGGNRFLGPKLIESLLAKGHEVTVFNRGNDYGQTIPKEVKVIVGDRREAKNLEALGKESYDYVYDTCCYNPLDATNILGAIKPTAHLVLLSTAAVYKKPLLYPMREDSELGEWDSFGDYGTNKVLAENLFIEYAKKHSLKLTIFRPVYLLGDMNYFDRENYYFSRIEKGLPILVPGHGNALIQFAFLKETTEAFAEVPLKQSKPLEILNIAGDDYITVSDFVTLCAKVAQKEAKLVHLDTERFGLEEEHFYDELYPFPNLNFVVSNERVKSGYGVRFQNLAEGMQELYDNWKSNWDGEVRTYPEEKKILDQLEKKN